MKFSISITLIAIVSTGCFNTLSVSERARQHGIARQCKSNASESDQSDPFYALVKANVAYHSESVEEECTALSCHPPYTRGEVILSVIKYIRWPCNAEKPKKLTIGYEFRPSESDYSWSPNSRHKLYEISIKNGKMEVFYSK